MISEQMQALLGVYERAKLELLIEHEGKYALVHDVDVSTWNTYDDALQAGYERYGLSQFLVKQILRVDKVETL